MKRLLSLLLAVMLILQVVPIASAEEAVDWKLTILHTNDTHAHLENEAKLVTAIKQQLDGKENFLLLHAGDVFSGTLFFNKYEGLADLKFMNMLGYHAMTIGNHEFDNGPKALANFVKEAKFPVLSANIDFSKENELSSLASTTIGENASDFAGKIFPAVILDVHGEKVGVFGLTTVETEFISNPGKNIKFNDVVSTAKATVKSLEEKGVNKIIALTHIGYSDDIKLAEAVDGIDIIVGGHSHTVVNEPVKVKNTYVVQAGEYAQYLGRVDISFNKEGVVTQFNGQLINITEKDEKGNFKFAEDPEAKKLYDELSAPIEEMKSTDRKSVV